MDPHHCAFCHQVIGVYEPIRVVFSGGVNRHGSVLTLGDQLDAPGVLVLHERCYEAFGRGGRQGEGDGAA